MYQSTKHVNFYSVLQYQYQSEIKEDIKQKGVVCVFKKKQKKTIGQRFQGSAGWHLVEPKII